MSLPSSIDETQALLTSARYVADRALSTVLFLSMKLGRPLFLEGEAGVGKTEIAKTVSAALGRPLIRLQCYEGLDVNSAVYEWNYSAQMVEIRLAEAAGDLNKDQAQSEIFSERFLIKRPLLQALEQGVDGAPVLLIDELDRADEAFEAYLLEVLSDYQITVPELGTFKAEEPPIVIITSNRTREIHDALKRRCLYHWVGYPDAARELSIIQARLPNAAENLAREVLELHTLGVSGTYTQNDVTSLAKLMTGLSADLRKGFVFRGELAEPGSEKVLGKVYGGGLASASHVMAAMDDIAVHPETARHICGKLAAHFVSNNPDPMLVEELIAVYQATDGALLPVYDVLINHPASMRTFGAKVKLPFEFIASALVALGFSGKDLQKLPLQTAAKFLYQPMADMGQRFFSPPGPDGWSEDPAAWITPQGLATRINWSLAIANRTQGRVRDPRAFLDLTLGDVAGRQLSRSVSGAQTHEEGLALVLASSEFNRR